MIEAIRDSAFVTSEYPVILSFENHCRYCFVFFVVLLIKSIWCFVYDGAGDLRNIQTDPLHCLWSHNETPGIHLLIIFLVRDNYTHDTGEYIKDHIFELWGKI